MLTNWGDLLTNVPSNGGGAAIAPADYAGTLTVANQAARLALVYGTGTGQVQELDQVLQTSDSTLWVLLANDPSVSGNWSRLPGNDASALTTGTLPAARYTSSPTTNYLQKYNGTVLANSTLYEETYAFWSSKGLLFDTAVDPWASPGVVGITRPTGGQLCLQSLASHPITFLLGSTYLANLREGGLAINKGTTASTAFLDVRGTTEQLRLEYSSGVDAKHTVSAAGDYSIRPTGECLALGNAAYSTGSRSIAIGASASVASGCTQALAIGYGATVATGGLNSLAIGDLANCSSSQGLALGYSTTASGGAGAVAIGNSTTASTSSSVAIGRGTNATGSDAIAIGYSSLASGAYAIAVGPDPTASGDYSIALGYLAAATTTNTIAIGTAAAAAITNTMVIGSDLRPINTIWAGKGEPNATPTGWGIRGTSGLGTNIAGGDIYLDAGAGTGTGATGLGHLRATTVLTTGTTLQSTWNNKLSWNSVGIGLNGATPVAQSTGWSVANPVTNKTLDVSTATLGELREIVGTLLSYILTRGDIAA